MILICNVCRPIKGDWRYGDPGVLPIAKWYPASTQDGIATDGSYYFNGCGNDGMVLEWARKILGFWQLHQHMDVAPQGVEYPIRLEYESEEPLYKPEELEI